MSTTPRTDAEGSACVTIAIGDSVEPTDLLADLWNARRALAYIRDKAESPTVTRTHLKEIAKRGISKSGGPITLKEATRDEEVTAERDELRQQIASLICTHHTDRQRVECHVCLVTQLRAENTLLRAAQKISEDTDEQTVKEVLTLRAEVEQKRNLLVTAIRSAGDQAARAERAEAEMERLTRLLDEYKESRAFHVTRAETAEREVERLQYHQTIWGRSIVQMTARAERAEAELATERARVRLLRDELRRLQNIVCPDDFECIDAALGATEGAK